MKDVKNMRGKKMKTEKMIFNNKEIIIKYDIINKTLKIGSEIFFPSIQDLNYFINKLSDISEEMKNEI